jgi:uncharacterized protein YbcI
MLAVANEMVRLHKEQFGRGPTHARAGFAGPNTMVCTLGDVMLPAEHALVKLGEGLRVQESRMFLQHATSETFISAVEGILDRKVRGFSSAIDPGADIAWEVFQFQPQPST